MVPFGKQQEILRDLSTLPLATAPPSTRAETSLAWLGIVPRQSLDWR
jgi:hypothetical protein